MMRSWRAGGWLFVIAVLGCGDDMAGPSVAGAGGAPGTDASNTGADANVPEGGFAASYYVNECTTFFYFACCAWGCELDGVRAHDASEEPLRPPYDCPWNVPGLSEPGLAGETWRECVIGQSGLPDRDREGVELFDQRPEGAVCRFLIPEACGRVIDCIDAKGGVDALEALGYPSPGSTSSCPAPSPASTEDAGDDGNAGG